MNFAWDFARNCYSTTINLKGVQQVGSTSCDGKTLGFTSQAGGCTSSKDATIWNTTIPAYFESTFVVNEGVVPDPFFPERTDTFTQWRSNDLNNWIWIRVSDNALIYKQEFNVANSRKTLIYYFPNGFNAAATVTSYNFMLFKCSK